LRFWHWREYEPIRWCYSMTRQRTEARRLGLLVCGAPGILVRAYRERLHSIDQLELLFQEIAARPDIWIASRPCQAVLDSVREPPQDLG